MTARTRWTSRGRRTLGRLAVAALGLVVLTGCGGTVYDLPLPGGADVGSDPLTVRVEFRYVLDLVPQSTVKVNDVTVGKVTGIKLKGYTADVSLALPKDTDLPDNTRAEIRQTSLLGEKFVSLEAPDDPQGKLSSGDVIPLSRSGRNPEVEEVLGALSLLLNGGGVEQLRTIANELNNALGGREEDVRNVLEQLRVFTGQLDQGKAKIVRAIESLNRLALAAKRQDSTIKLTLDELPSSIASINSQRADLVKTLKALDNLSDVGVRVIKETKADTIATVNDLGPVLDKLADAGSALPRSTQVALSYPFVDEAVGRNPQVARNLHLGDYVNLSANLDIDSSLLGEGCKFVAGTIKGVLSQAGLTGTALDGAVNQAVALFVADGGVCDQFQTLTQGLLDRLSPLLDQLAPGLKIGTEALNDALSAVFGGLTPGSGASLPTLPTTPTTPTKPTSPLSGLTQQRQSNGGGVLGGLLDGGSRTQKQQSQGSARSKRSPSSGSSSSGSSGGFLGNLFGGMLGRAATGFDVREGNGQRGDVLNGPSGTSSELGYNSTLGALLLQGVSAS